jgi:iron complex outermembrane receptor protein
MRGFLLSAVILAVFSLGSAAQETDSGRHERIDSVVVSVSRAGKNTPVTYSTLGKDRLSAANPINSLPMNLSLLPSVVSSNEGGTGLGNSKLTIRGSKGSQINVTLNGITLNDSESQEVFWVNIPALSALLGSVQVQRGLGTSANGAGAFGASINMSTAFVSPAPSARFEVSAGSYNTFMATLSASTGLTPSGFYMSAAYSKGLTDGYIRNAKADVMSAFAVLGWLKGNNSLRLTYLNGDQHTGITWNGISLEQYAMDRRYNDAGEHYDADGNLSYYGNETDNYSQHHVQFNYTHSFTDALVWSTTLNYTRGDGYDEYYKESKKLGAYGAGFFGAGRKGDVIIRKNMSNDYYVVNSDLRFRSRRVDVTGGVNAGYYKGRHWGTLLWSELLGGGVPYSYLNGKDVGRGWYMYRGNKYDISAFVRTEALLTRWLTAYADLQYRRINYTLAGRGDKYDAIFDYDKTWNFFNPRAGLTASWKGSKAYASVALGHREPGKSEIKELCESISAGGNEDELKPERMVDVEIGYQYSAKTITVAANLYLMEYRDMLLETGRLSSSGYPIKSNVPFAYRRGVELSAEWQPAPWVSSGGNLTLSLNRIPVYNDYAPCIDNPDDWNELGYSMSYKSFENTTMLLSPGVTGAAILTFKPWALAHNSLKTTSFSINGKYVGKQYLDNTSNDDFIIPSYFVANLELSHSFALRKGSINLSAYVNNIFNKLYYADGGTWKYLAVSDQSADKPYLIEGAYVYPQPPANFMIKLGYSF